MVITLREAIGTDLEIALSNEMEKFRCMDKDVENYLINKSLEFDKRHKSRTSLIVDGHLFNNGVIKILAYFTLTMKTLKFNQGLSKSKIKRIFDMALSNGWCSSLPYTKIEMPTKSKQPKTPLTQEQIEMLQKCGLNPRQKVFVYFGLMCGLRKGEILALTVDDIQLTDKPYVKIRNNNVNGSINPYPKTQAGNREIPIPNKLAELLKDYTEKLDGKILVPQEKNQSKYQTNSSYVKFWDGIVRKSNLDITAHLLRHTYATKLYYAGVDVKTAQYLLGHATLQMTLSIYDCVIIGIYQQKPFSHRVFADIMPIFISNHLHVERKVGICVYSLCRYQSKGWCWKNHHLCQSWYWTCPSG